MGVFVPTTEGLPAAYAQTKTVINDATYLKAPRTASSLRVIRSALGGGSATTRRHEHEAACCHRCEWSPTQLFHDRWASRRLHRCRSADGREAKGPVATRRPRLRRRLVQDALQAKGIQPVFQVLGLGSSLSGTTSAGTGAATASNSCPAVSRTGVASQPATIGSRQFPSSPSPSQPPSSSGSDQ